MEERGLGLGIFDGIGKLKEKKEKKALKIGNHLGF